MNPAPDDQGPGPFVLDEAMIDAYARAAEADREYFEAHPHERERIRAPLPGEWPGARLIRVVQIAPGARVRCPWA